jgi:mono/diheme cytochrome c family protein
MWKSALAGLIIAVLAIAGFVGIGCATFFGTAVCAIDRTKPTAPTVQSPERHKLYMRAGAPEPYRDIQNPQEASIANVVEGARLYDLRCAVCHGMMGVGDGDAGARLDVQPADLGRSLGQPLYKDDFFYWSISEGGAEFKTDMPPFKNDLTDREIWRILTFMRATFSEQRKPSGPLPHALPSAPDTD